MRFVADLSAGFCPSVSPVFSLESGSRLYVLSNVRPRDGRLLTCQRHLAESASWVAFQPPGCLESPCSTSLMPRDNKMGIQGCHLIGITVDCIALHCSMCFIDRTLSLVSSSICESLTQLAVGNPDQSGNDASKTLSLRLS